MTTTVASADTASPVLDEHASDALLGPAEIELRARLRAVIDHDVAPRAPHVDSNPEAAFESYAALADARLAGLLVPRVYGGTENTTLAYAMSVEEIAAACPSASLIYMTQMHAAYPILHSGRPEVIRRWVPGLCDGSVLGSLGITEPDAGSDVSTLRTTASPVTGGYLLNGEKTFITTGDRAGVIACFASVGRDLGRNGITGFVVDGSADGLEHGAPFSKLGMHGSSTAQLHLRDVFVPGECVLGAPGSGWSIVMSSVIKSRVSAAAQGVGIARGAFLAAWRATRPGSVGEATRFARLRGRILQGRLLLYATARAIDFTPGDVTAADIGIMKTACTALGVEVALEALDLLGARGDFVGLGVERFARDAKVTEIYDGANEIQDMLVGRDLVRWGARAR